MAEQLVQLESFPIIFGPFVAAGAASRIDQLE